MRGPAARVPGHQLADHRLRRHLLTRPHDGPDRLVAGAQSAGMGQRHHRSSRQQPGEHHGRGPGGVNRLARAPGQVHAAVPGIPVGRRGVESADNGRGGSQRPIQPDVVGSRRECADQGQGQVQAHDQRRPPHPISSAWRRRLGDPRLPNLCTDAFVWTGVDTCWEKHQLSRCKLLVAARSRADFARLPRGSRSTRSSHRVPGGPDQVFLAGSGIAAGARVRLHPMPGDNRHKGMPSPWPS